MVSTHLRGEPDRSPGSRVQPRGPTPSNRLLGRGRSAVEFAGRALRLVTRVQPQQRFDEHSADLAPTVLEADIVDELRGQGAGLGVAPRAHEGLEERQPHLAAQGPLRIGADTATATVEVLTAASTPVAGVGDLAITEVLADPPPALAGDYNCDGIRDTSDDEFIELKNIATRAVALTGVGVWDATAFSGTSPVATFGTYLLGPGEMVAVFSGGVVLGDLNLAAGPWCDSLLDSDGDAIALGAPFNLTNTGDTVRLTATSARASTVLATFTYLSTADQSLVRDPAPLGPVVPYTNATGALADRKASPSTNTDGSDQAAFDRIP